MTTEEEKREQAIQNIAEGVAEKSVLCGVQG